MTKVVPRNTSNNDYLRGFELCEKWAPFSQFTLYTRRDQTRTLSVTSVNIFTGQKKKNTDLSSYNIGVIVKSYEIILSVCFRSTTVRKRTQQPASSCCPVTATSSILPGKQTSLCMERSTTCYTQEEGMGWLWKISDLQFVPTALCF